MKFHTGRFLLALYFYFSGQDPLVVLVIAGQQSGRIQTVGTFCLALVAVQAALDLFHFGLTRRAQVLGRGRAPQQQAHAGTVVDLDARRAGHAVTAAPAELAAQLSAVMVDDRLDLSGHAGRVVDVGEELVQLLFPLHAPDGQHPVVLGLKGVGGGTVGDEPAGKALHGDKAHVGGLALVDQFQLLLTGNVAERELQRLIQAAVNGLVGHRQPVVRDADRLNLNGLAVAIDSLALKARDNKLMPDDISGGTFTITNFGTFKSLFGTPIINQPQVAILGVGYIEKKPAVIETPEGDVIAIRHKMYLSLSYDHRVVDGSLGGNFLYFIKDYLENWKE